MDRTHFVCIHTSSTTSDAPLSFMADNDDYVFESELTPNPFDSDDPEVAYHEYLALRFSE
jgi:hypothetical protein